MSRPCPMALFLPVRAFYFWSLPRWHDTFISPTGEADSLITRRPLATSLWLKPEREA